MVAKRSHSRDSEDSDTCSSSGPSDDGWKEHVVKKSLKKNARKPKSSNQGPAAVKVASKASILSLASNETPGSLSASERLAEIDSSVLGKIKKALALGGHQGTGEAEAKRAMRLATKLMAQHNVNQADILAAEDDSEKLKRAGQSTVAIKSTSGKAVVIHSWSSTAAQAIEVFFDCKSYSTSFGDRDRLDWTFYGLSEQTVAAAYAYEMVYNLILVWSAQNKNAKGRTGKNNYCHGVARGLYELAKRDRRDEEKQVARKEKERLTNALKVEEEDHKRTLERLKGPASPKKEDIDVKVKIEEVPDESVMPKSARVMQEDAKMESDDDDDADVGFFMHDPEDDTNDIQADFDDREGDINQMLQEFEHDLNPAPELAARDEVAPSIKIEQNNNTPWTSSQQLTLFRSNASAIADDFLKQSKIKLRKGPSRAGPRLQDARDMEVYRQGKKDARNIDVKRKRIKGMDDD